MSTRGYHPRRTAPKPGCRFVAARDLRVNGREFKAGETFPYAELGLVYARAVMLWTAGRLKVDSDAPPAVPPAPQPPVVQRDTKPAKHRRS